MAIVTIRGTLGSGAPEIGNQIAERLHFDYVDREIIADVAKRIKWSEESTAAKEMPPGTLGGRIAEALGHTYPIGDGFGGAYLPTWHPKSAIDLFAIENHIKTAKINAFGRLEPLYWGRVLVKLIKTRSIAIKLEVFNGLLASRRHGLSFFLRKNMFFYL
jgi:hypothetical protein